MAWGRKARYKAALAKWRVWAWEDSGGRHLEIRYLKKREDPNPNIFERKDWVARWDGSYKTTWRDLEEWLKARGFEKYRGQCRQWGKRAFSRNFWDYE